MAERRRPSASPVCYADEPGIDPSYMWAGAAPGTRVRLKRVYEAPAADDGARILVERLWPRGVAKDKAALASWEKDVAPSPELRKWYGHDHARWDEFRRRYLDELAQLPEARAAVTRIRERAARESVTLVYATREAAYSSAAILAGVLAESGD